MRMLRSIVALALLLAPSVVHAQGAGGAVQGAVGAARVPNRAAGDNSTYPANTAYVDAAAQVLLSTIATKAPLFSPAFTGAPTVPSPLPGTNSAQIAPTSFVAALVAAEAGRAQSAEGLLAPLASPAFTGSPTAPVADAGDSSTRIATTSFATAVANAVVASERSRAQAVEATLAPLASPAFTGSPTAPTPAVSDASTRIATTSFVAASFLAKMDAASTYAPLASPALTGTPTAPTPAASDSSTRLATTAFSTSAVTTEASRAQAAEALLAPKANPTLSGTVTVQPGGSVLIQGTAGANQDKTILVGSNGTLSFKNGSGQIFMQIDDAGNVYVANAAQYVIQGLPIIGPRQPTVTKATGSSDVVATVNSLIDRMVSHGLIYPNP